MAEGFDLQDLFSSQQTSLPSFSQSSQQILTQNTRPLNANSASSSSSGVLGSSPFKKQAPAGGLNPHSSPSKKRSFPISNDEDADEIATTLDQLPPAIASWVVNLFMNKDNVNELIAFGKSYESAKSLPCPEYKYRSYGQQLLVAQSISRIESTVDRIVDEAIPLLKKQRVALEEINESVTSIKTDKDNCLTEDEVSSLKKVVAHVFFGGDAQGYSKDSAMSKVVSIYISLGMVEGKPKLTLYQLYNKLTKTYKVPLTKERILRVAYLRSVAAKSAKTKPESVKGAEQATWWDTVDASVESMAKQKREDVKKVLQNIYEADKKKYGKFDREEKSYVNGNIDKAISSAFAAASISD
ncbi:unnamed protein product [Tilletia caries]|uniref:Uncharacterized protein n=1 Tax=Tilletia caries TaxID=13290 RepID=A0ABN7J790_9BASI|nr:unnamed protein product [Tilletia caries]